MLSVLVIDDEAPTRMLLRRMLALLDCESAEASNGVEGETLALTMIPDLILLDLMMPIQDGYTTCKNLRQKGYNGTIIIVSALPQVSEMRKSAQAGATAYLEKPITRDTLKIHVDFLRQNGAAVV